MLLSRYQHNMDEKGRVSIPAKLREALGERFVATKGTDRCVCIYSMEDWAVQEQKILALTSEFSHLQRYFFSNAAELELDKQGRVLVPQHLRQYGELDGEVLITGVGNRVEIWNPSRWNTMEDDLTPESVMEQLKKLGI